MGRGKFTLTIHDRPQSWNKWWSGMHWSKRSAEKNRVKMEVLAALGTTDIEMFEVPVWITFHVYQKGPWKDWSNICLKPYEDALIGLVIEDDGPDYVKGGSIWIHKADEDRIEITITPVA